MKIKRISKILLTLFLFLIILGTKNNVIAANGMAFSAGKGYGNLDVSQITTNCYNSYSKMGYNSYYATNDATYSTLAGKFSNGTKRLESDIVFLTGHAWWKSINTLINAGVEIGDGVYNNYVGTNSINWGRTKLVVFAGCKTGEETSNSEINLAYNVFKRSNWTTTSIGWRQTIYDNSLLPWMNNFNAKLASGATVSEALNYAGSQKYKNDSIKDLAFYGNQKLVLKKSKNLSNIKINESNITYITDNIEFNGTNEQVVNIINLLKQKDKNFNIKDYKMDIYTISKESKYYIIDFTYIKEGTYTNSTYTVIVNDGRVIQIADNTIDFKRKNLDTNFNIKEEEIAKETAKSNIIRENIQKCINSCTTIRPITIREQNLRKYIDLNTGKKYIQVFTVYGYEDSEATAGSQYDYEI